MVALQLMKGLEKIGVPFRFNDYKYIKKHPTEIACIIGKPHILFDRPWKNPIIFGAGIYSHPIECPDILQKNPNIKRILVPGDWMKLMFEPFYGNKVLAWPTGIDTDIWKPDGGEKEFDFLIYNKIRWDYTTWEHNLLNPIKETLNNKGLTYTSIRYGHYNSTELKNKLNRSKAAIFLCEHETQGLAYQQILSSGVPVLAWDRGGYWQDPYYYPHKVKFQPVSSVPYWDERCGAKFADAAGFEQSLNKFWSNLGNFNPRAYVLENLTLEHCAQKYIDIYNEVAAELGS